MHKIYGIKDKGHDVCSLLRSKLPMDEVQMDMATGEVLLREQSQQLGELDSSHRVHLRGWHYLLNSSLSS